MLGKGKSWGLLPAREEACLQDEITCSSDSLSDHLAGETRTETMVVGGATAWLELRRYAYLLFYIWT